jgi:hypothetical protein
VKKRLPVVTQPNTGWREVYESVKDIVLPTLFALALPFVIVLLVLFLSGCGAPTPGGSCADWAAKQAPRGVDFKLAVEICRDEIRAGRRPCLRYGGWNGTSCAEVVEEGIDFAIAPVEAP